MTHTCCLGRCRHGGGGGEEEEEEEGGMRVV